MMAFSSQNKTILEQENAFRIKQYTNPDQYMSPICSNVGYTFYLHTCKIIFNGNQYAYPWRPHLGPQWPNKIYVTCS